MEDVGVGNWSVGGGFARVSGKKVAAFADAGPVESATGEGGKPPYFKSSLSGGKVWGQRMGGCTKLSENCSDVSALAAFHPEVKSLSHGEVPAKREPG